MKGVKVLLIREGEKRKMNCLWDWVETEQKGKKDKRPENNEQQVPYQLTQKVKQYLVSYFSIKKIIFKSLI